MNEKLSYATMLEIPVSTCNVTYKKPKRRLFRKKSVNPDVVKQQLINKVNSEEINSDKQENQISEAENNSAVCEMENNNVDSAEFPGSENAEEVTYAQEKTVNITKAEKKKRFKFSVIGFQVAVVFILIGTIIVTNAVYAGSGINVFFNSIFNSPSEKVDTRVYKDFSPVLNAEISDDFTLNEEGVMTFNKAGSIYAPCNGKVSKIEKLENGKYSIEITHSENFRTVLGGIDNAYVGMNDTIYNNIPVGYIRENGATLCFTNGEGAVISDYQVVDDMVVWQV